MTDDVRETDHENSGDGGGGVTAAPDDEVAAALVERFAGAIFHWSHGQPVVYLDRARLADAAAFLRDEQQFTMCVDVTAVDHMSDGVRHCAEGVDPERFEVLVSFLSHVRNRRIRIICEVPEADATVPSVTGAYPGANFPEREAYDMFGIVFQG